MNPGLAIRKPSQADHRVALKMAASTARLRRSKRTGTTGSNAFIFRLDRAELPAKMNP
jgi:hypothetical protein